MNRNSMFHLILALFILLAVFTTLLYSDLALASQTIGRNYTTNEDFAEGTMVGVKAVDDQIELAEEITTLPFIWVPNNSGAISKVDTETGDELGRYQVVPPELDEEFWYGSPSRTTVDLQGNVWVGNRRAGTVVKVGLLEAGQYLDRNNDGEIQTSRDLDNDGDIIGAEILPWGEDECVLFEVVLVPGHEGTYAPGEYEGPYDTNNWGTSPRSLAVDASNNLWVGTGSPQKFYYIDGETGDILDVIDVSFWRHEAYGATIDKNGVIWSLRPLLRIDPAAISGFNPISSSLIYSGETLEYSTSAPGYQLTTLTAETDITITQSNGEANLIMSALNTTYDNTVFGDVYNNEAKEHNLHINSNMHNQFDDTKAEVISPSLDLSCIYPLENVDSPGTQVEPQAGFDVRWEYANLAEGEGVHAHGATNRWATLQSGLTVSRELDRVIFSEPGAQVVTLRVTPQEVMDRLQIHLNPEHDQIDAAVTDYLVTDGENVETDLYDGVLNAWINDPVVGQIYEWEITLNVYSLPDGFETLEYVPSIFVQNVTILHEGVSKGSSLTRSFIHLDETIATFNWQAEGEYEWHWEQVFEKQVYMRGYASDGSIDVHLSFRSDYGRRIFADSVNNDEAMFYLGVGTGLHNMFDGKYGAVQNLRLNLSSDYYINNVYASGTEVTPPEGVDYSWEFADVEMGHDENAHAGLENSLYLTPGFEATREVDQRVFTEPGTQLLTLTVTPKEEMDQLYIHLNPEESRADAAVIGASGEGAYVHGICFDAWIDDPVVDQTYVWEIEIEIYSIPPGFLVLEYMPDISINSWLEYSEGIAKGSDLEMQLPDLVEEATAATWHWQADGTYNWHWQREIGKGVLLGGYINDPEGAIRRVIVPHEEYALAPDYLGNLFITGSSENKLTKIDILTDEIIFSKDTKPGFARGVTVTKDNNVWVADTYRNSVLRYDNDGNELAEIEGLNGPSGVSVDAAGKIWATDLESEYIHRIDPETNTIDLSKRIIDSWGHYSYSDMTGMVARTITTKTGSWTVIYDSEAADTPWGTLTWNCEEPEGTSITVRARSSADSSNWSGWETAVNGELLVAIPDGRYIQIEATLQITAGDESPILYDLTIEPFYEARFDVVWLPPLTNDGFALQDGTTLPIKFQLLDEDGELINEMVEGIYLRVEDVETWTLGSGNDDLRYDEKDYQYVANFHTRNYGLADGIYEAVVYDANEVALGRYQFELRSEQGVSRGVGAR